MVEPATKETVRYTTMNTGSARKPTMRGAARPGGPAVSDRRTCCHSRGGAEKVRPFRAAGASNRRSALTAPNRESVSSLRRRRSALVLLAEFGISLLCLVEMKHQAILDLLGQHPIRIRQ